MALLTILQFETDFYRNFKFKKAIENFKSANKNQSKTNYVMVCLFGKKLIPSFS